MFHSVHGKDLNSSNSYYTQRPELGTPRKLTKISGCLEIIDGEGPVKSRPRQESPSNCCPTSTRPGYSRNQCPTSRPTGAQSFSGGKGHGSCWSQGSIGCIPPRADTSMSRRMNTPTKQVSLQAVRRKDESAEPFVDQVDWQALVFHNNPIKTWELGANTADKPPSKSHIHEDSFRLESVVDTSQHATKLSLFKPSRPEQENSSQLIQCSDISSDTFNQQNEMSTEGKNRDDKSDDDDSGDDDSDSSDEDEEKLRAPNELLMEFVDCLMRKDYQTASKLCQMVLLYEPENPEALKFQPLIEERLTLDTEAEQDGSGDDDDDSEDDDSEDDDSEDDEDSNDDDSSGSTDDDDEDDDDGGEAGSSNNNNNNNKMWSDSHLRSCVH